MVNPSNTFPAFNYPVDSAVDKFEAALWWFEPNVGTAVSDGVVVATESPADIYMKLHRSSGTTYSAVSEVGKQHLQVGNVIAGDTWTVKLTGRSVPTSTDTIYQAITACGTCRAAYVAFYWEDTARDDTDGPTLEIQ